MKDCGSCKWFVKVCHVKVHGLCTLYECNTTSDGGSRCPEYKRKKYKRRKENNFKLNVDNERTN